MERLNKWQHSNTHYKFYPVLCNLSLLSTALPCSSVSYAVHRKKQMKCRAAEAGKANQPSGAKSETPLCNLWLSLDSNLNLCLVSSSEIFFICSTQTHPLSKHHNLRQAEAESSSCQWNDTTGCFHIHWWLVSILSLIMASLRTLISSVLACLVRCSNNAASYPYILKAIKSADCAFQFQKICGKSAKIATKNLVSVGHFFENILCFNVFIEKLSNDWT